MGQDINSDQSHNRSKHHSNKDLVRTPQSSPTLLTNISPHPTSCAPWIEQCRSKFKNALLKPLELLRQSTLTLATHLTSRSLGRWLSLSARVQEKSILFSDFTGRDPGELPKRFNTINFSIGVDCAIKI